MAGITALDLNPYLYCANNPINRLDPDGKSWKTFLATAIAGAAVAITLVIASVAIIPAIIIAAAVSVAVGIGCETYNYYKNNKGNTNWKGYAKAASKGAAIGAAGGTAGAAIGAGIGAAAVAIYNAVILSVSVATMNLVSNKLAPTAPSTQSAQKVVEKSNYTKSNLRLGQQMHKNYMKSEIVEGVKMKEFYLSPRSRVDFINFENRTIYELKPNNPLGIKSGTNQLLRYQNDATAAYGEPWNTHLDVY